MTDTATPAAADAGQDILFEERGALGLVTLNRPKALNALTHAMILALEARLERWRHDPAIRIVAIRGAGERAFCAGGDIRALYEAGRPGGARGRANFQFYADEYRLNTMIKRYPKPYVALMDGIVMGGGVGVSIHGSHRIATERTVFAMPETGIGLFPDVGGTYFLPRLPKETGMWLGLTGTRLKGDDVAGAKLADMVLPSAALDDLLASLAAPDGAIPEAIHAAMSEAGRGGALDRLARLVIEPLDQTAWQAHLDHLQAMGSVFVDGIMERHTIYGAESPTAILAALEAEGSPLSLKQRDTILSKSPTCTEIAYRQIRTGATLDFEDCMALEYRLARFCMTHPDFYEGVRATIIEKSTPPTWTPQTLAEVDPTTLESAFMSDPDLPL